MASSRCRPTWVSTCETPAAPSWTARAQISPLPDLIDFSLTPPGANQETDPLRFLYEASQTVDVDAVANLIFPEAAPNATCGAKGTLCAELGLRNLPAKIEARVVNLLDRPRPESRIEVDLTPRPGGVKPDLVADVIYGQEDKAPLVAHAELDGLSKFIRFRTHAGRGGNARAGRAAHVQPQLRHLQLRCRHRG